MMNEPEICSPGNHRWPKLPTSQTNRSNGTLIISQCNNCVAVLVKQQWPRQPVEFKDKTLIDGRVVQEAIWWSAETIVAPQVRFLV